MLRIDAHQHFWIYDPIRDSWITEGMKIIRRNFLPHDLKTELEISHMDGCVLVQTCQEEIENNFLLEQARSNSFIKGVVGWVDLCSPSVGERLEYYRQFPVMKGFRHVLQGEADRAFMLKPSFLNGIKSLSKWNYTYDILIYTDQLEYTLEFVKKFPDQRFVIDHIAKPEIKLQRHSTWQEKIKKFAPLQNVYCKMSGMVTEADWHHWRKEDFFPYMNTALETFGFDRLMFGSDWPVCLVAASYQQVMDLTQSWMSQFTQSEKDKFYGVTAVQFYSLTP